MVSSKGRGGGDPTDPWTHLQNRIGVFVQDDFKVGDSLTLNLGLRWAYTSPLVEKDNRQSNFDLDHRPADHAPATAASRIARSTSPTTRASSRGSAWRGRSATVWWCAAATASRSSWRAPARTCGLPLNPPFFFESAVNYDVTTGAGTAASGFAGLVPGTTPDRQRARLRSRPASAVHAAVERVRRVPGQLVDVGAGRLRRPSRRSSGHAGRGQPGAARRRRSRDLGAEEHAPAALRRAAARHHHRHHRRARRQPSQLDAGERPPAQSSTASSSWRRTRWAARAPTTAASTACSAAPDCRA